MPIINGTYVYDNLSSGDQNIQQQVFGPGWKSTKKDMADYSAAAYNYLMKQQEQAYNLDLWNLMNEYNSPSSQMQRFQDAGLNPNLIYSQQNTASAPSAASASSFRSGGTYARNTQAKVAQTQAAFQAMGQIMNVVKTARETYDYMKYGAETSRWNMINTQEGAFLRKLNVAWNDYLLHGDNMIYGDAQRMVGGPQATMYQRQSDAKAETIRQIGALIQHYAKTDERFDKLIELDDQRLSQMKGQNDFILHGFDTGNETLNSFLRMLMYFGLNSGL